MMRTTCPESRMSERNSLMLSAHREASSRRFLCTHRRRCLLSAVCSCAIRASRLRCITPSHHIAMTPAAFLRVERCSRVSRSTRSASIHASMRPPSATSTLQRRRRRSCSSMARRCASRCRSSSTRLSCRVSSHRIRSMCSSFRFSASESTVASCIRFCTARLWIRARDASGAAHLTLALSRFSLRNPRVIERSEISFLYDSTRC
mmetsp:Transcript_16423/g.53649  ORF Transcript_16423/g.53649 Transcript_16423/m.53649 type:complete len:205 (-) Transcript_16423:278-892(-)